MTDEHRHTDPDAEAPEPRVLSERFGWQDDDEVGLLGPDGKTRETEEEWLRRIRAKPDPHYYTDEEKAKMSEEERESVTPGDLRPRFGWQEGDTVQFLDDMGNPLTPEQWQERMAEKRRKRLAGEKGS